MNSKAKAYLLGLGALVIIAIVGAGTLKPQRTYEVEDNQSPLALGNAHSPLPSTQTLLQQSAYLPPIQDLPQCLEVDPSNLAGVSSPLAPARQITEIKFTAVHLSSFASLLVSVLDDDPIYQAAVDGLAVTADGSRTPFTTSAWDYGLLTPWSLHHEGDGWKLFKVCYGPTGRTGRADWTGEA